MNEDLQNFLWVFSFACLIIFGIFLLSDKPTSFSVEETPSVNSVGTCSDSLDCEYDCFNFYGENVENHFLECRYKCLTLLNCEDKQ